MAKKIIIVIGEMGVGKTYVAQKIAEKLGVPFVEGDNYLSWDVKDRVSKFKMLSEDLVAGSIRHYLCPQIQNEIAHGIGLVVSQALYRKKLREWLRSRLQMDQDISVSFYLVKVPLFQNIKQLWARQNGLRWVIYWLLNKPFFQKQLADGDIIIDNKIS